MRLRRLMVVGGFVFLSAASAFAQLGTAFQYQGELIDSGVPANGPYDFTFELYDALAAGSQVGSTIIVEDLPVMDGVFDVPLDFGAVFDGTQLWLQVSVRAGASVAAHTALAPRQEMSPVPYAMFATNAATATNVTNDAVDDADADPTNERNTTLALNGTTLELTDSGGMLTTSLAALIDDADADPTNELQDLQEVLTMGDDAGGLDAVNLANVGIGIASPAEALHIDDGNLLQTPGNPTLTGSLTIGTFPRSVYVSGRYAYVVDYGSDDLKVIDVSDPTAPTLTGSLAIGTSPRSVYVSGRYAYVVDSGSDDLKVIDVSDPAAPSLAGSLTIGSFPESVYVSGRHAYVVDSGSSDLKVIDVSDPANPNLTGSLALGSFPWSVYVSGRHAYVVDIGSDDLKVIDVSDPANPTLTGSLAIGTSPVSVYVSGRYAYVVDSGSDDLRVIDVSDPAAPALAGSLAIGGSPMSVYVSGRYAYVVDIGSADLKMIDVSDPASPVLTGSLALGASPRSVYVSGRYAYVVDAGSSDLKVIDVSGGEMTSLMAHSLEAGNLQVRNDVVAQGQLQVTGGITAGAGGIFSDGNVGVDGQVKATAFVGDGSALTNLPAGDWTTLLNIPAGFADNIDNVDDADADPTNELQTLSRSGTNVTLSNGGGSVSIADNDNSVANEIQDLASVLTEGDDAGGLDAVNLANVGIGIASPAEALHIDDGNLLQTPGNPTLTGSLTIGTFPRSVYVSGRYAYVVDYGSDDLKVIDVSDPTAPTLTGSLAIGTSPRSVYVSGRYAYVVDSGSDDLKVIDVSDPAAPSLAGSLTIGSFPESVYVSGRHAYVVDSGSSDLKVIDVSDPANPTLTGSTGSLALGSLPWSVYVSGRHAYVVDIGSDDLKVIDVSDPTAPTLTGSLAISTSPRSVYVSGRYAYIVDWGSNDLKVIDVSDPTAPTLTGSLAIGTSPRSVYVSGRYAYVVDEGSDDLKVIDVLDPASPVLTGSLALGASPRSVYVSGRYAYVVDAGSSDLKVIDVSGGEMTSLMAHSLEAGNLQVRNDIIAQGQLQVTGGITAGAGGIFSDGNVGVEGQVKVRASVTGSGISDHVARIQNDSSSSRHVLALRMQANSPGPGNNYITFFNRADVGIGAIEGDNAGGVIYKSGSADFAEYLLRLDPNERIEAGDVVGVFGGRISKRTAGADWVMVVSTAPITLGAMPQPEEEAAYEKVAFLGQAPVRVRGPVRLGDYLVASGLGDGTAVAISPANLRPENGRLILGRAWEASNDPGAKLVNTAVGIAEAHATTAVLQAQITELEARLAKLESLIGAGDPTIASLLPKH